jgi:hypothetical protein
MDEQPSEWAEWDKWNEENQIWLFFGLGLLLLPGLFSLLFLGRGLKEPVRDSDQEKVADDDLNKEYWLSSDTDQDDEYVE